MLKGAGDVFFCSQHSTVAKTRRGSVAEPEQVGSQSARTAQLRDRDPGWLWDNEAEPRISSNRASPSRTAPATLAGVLLRSAGQAWT